MRKFYDIEILEFERIQEEPIVYVNQTYIDPKKFSRGFPKYKGMFTCEQELDTNKTYRIAPKNFGMLQLNECKIYKTIEKHYVFEAISNTTDIDKALREIRNTVALILEERE